MNSHQVVAEPLPRLTQFTGQEVSQCLCLTLGIAFHISSDKTLPLYCTLRTAQWLLWIGNMLAIHQCKRLFHWLQGFSCPLDLQTKCLS